MKPPANCILYTHVLLFSSNTVSLASYSSFSTGRGGRRSKRTQFTSLTPLACIGFLTSVVGRNHGTTLFCGAEQIHQISLVDDVAERIACLHYSLQCGASQLQVGGLWAPSRDIYIYHRPYIVPIVALQVIKPSFANSWAPPCSGFNGCYINQSERFVLAKQQHLEDAEDAKHTKICETITGHQLLGISWMPYSVHWCRILKMTSRSTLWLFNIAMEKLTHFLSSVNHLFRLGPS